MANGRANRGTSRDYFWPIPWNLPSHALHPGSRPRLATSSPAMHGVELWKRETRRGPSFQLQETLERSREGGRTIDAESTARCDSAGASRKSTGDDQLRDSRPVSGSQRSHDSCSGQKQIQTSTNPKSLKIRAHIPRSLGAGNGVVLTFWQKKTTAEICQCSAIIGMMLFFFSPFSLRL